MAIQDRTANISERSGFRSALGWARYGNYARSSRARAAQRAAVYRATHVGAVGLVAMAAFNAVILPALHPSGAGWFVVANGLLAAAGLVTLAGHSTFRRRPEVIAFLLALLPGVTSRVVAVAVPDAALLMMCYLLLVPGTVTVLVPWRTQTHLLWLAVYGIASLIFLLGPMARSLGGLQREDQTAAVVLAMAVSLVGHLLLQQSRLRDGAQVERGRALRRETIRQQAEIARLYAELLHTARFDPLTRVGNRRLLDEDLGALANRSSQSGGSAWVLAIDVDHFKQVNDKLGHEVGDRVLASVAHALRAQLRATDSIYRYGGDEFVVLLPDTSGPDVRLIAERLRRAVERCHFEGVSERLTVSLGAAPIGGKELQSADGRWLRDADAALYRVKATGRNAVSLVSPLSEPAAMKRAPRRPSGIPVQS